MRLLTSLLLFLLGAATALGFMSWADSVAPREKCPVVSIDALEYGASIYFREERLYVDCPTSPQPDPWYYVWMGYSDGDYPEVTVGLVAFDGKLQGCHDCPVEYGVPDWWPSCLPHPNRYDHVWQSCYPFIWGAFRD